jgi:hypothetical protein
MSAYNWHQGIDGAWTASGFASQLAIDPHHIGCFTGHLFNESGEELIPTMISWSLDDAKALAEEQDAAYGKSAEYLDSIFDCEGCGWTFDIDIVVVGKYTDYEGRHEVRLCPECAVDLPEPDWFELAVEEETEERLKMEGIR